MPASSPGVPAYPEMFPARLPPKLADLGRTGGLLTKAGVRGAPGVDDAQALLAIAMRRDDVTGPLLDLQAMSGLLGLALDVEFAPVERSCAALAVLDEQFDGVRAAVPGDDLPAPDGPGWPTVALVLSGDRGNTHTEAMLSWALSCTAEGGTLWLAGDKQKGFERYLKWALAAGAEGEVVGRDGGMRAARLTRGAGAALPLPEPQGYVWEDLRVVALPGVFSATALDRASALLWRHVGDVAGKRVLDLGCGTGVLGAAAAARGATVTLLDDDLLAVRSARATLDANGLAGDARHSDVASALGPDETFDLVLSNPPFHVGRRVVLDVAREFARAAGERLARGGEMRLVANDFLPYEAELGRWGDVATLAREGGFKVLRARKR